MCNKRAAYTSEEHLFKRYNANLVFSKDDYKPEMSAFEHTPAPILANDNLEELQLFRWGLIPPTWKKSPNDIWSGTINAKLEYFETRYAWKDITHQRCLVPTSEYFEHHWNDPKGKSKTLFSIKHADEELFSLAGLWSTWLAPSGEIFKTYTIVTTEANERMRYVHNKDAQLDYHRMPLMLNPEDEREWLSPSNDYRDFGFPNYQPRLIAEPVEPLAPPKPQQLDLF